MEMRLGVLALIAIAAMAGCGGDPLPHVKAPEQMTLYSLDGRPKQIREERSGKTEEDVETFHSYLVLGKIGVNDATKRQELISALKHGISNKPEQGARCFVPRHGLRIVETAKTIDYVICFECLRVHEYQPDQEMRRDLISDKVQPVFDKPLKEAGVPLAPK
jgi:hypothetical protein